MIDHDHDLSTLAGRRSLFAFRIVQDLYDNHLVNPASNEQTDKLTVHLTRSLRDWEALREKLLGQGFEEGGAA